MNPQYKKGVLGLCVLSLLHKQDRYGYEISDYLSQHIDIADGTVYPLLRKLKADGLEHAVYYSCPGYHELTDCRKSLRQMLPLLFK